ncbi:PucR family transcriptional regulator [Paenibacillus septentrionalis]|uniref:PucR family transcriptional regulator n=1 Tax=Paenibacillus septentrionalis TaxID=429342 RepID=UPI00363FD582
MSEAWYDQLELATALVAKELLRLESAKRNLKSASEQFFLRLIQGEFSSNAVIQSEASKLQVQLPGNGAVVVIQLEEVIGEGVLRKEVKRWLELHDRKKSMYSIVNGMIVLLLDQIDDKHLQAFQQSFEGQLHTLGYHAAIWLAQLRSFNMTRRPLLFNAPMIRSSLRRAIRTLYTNIYYYENLGYIHFLSEVTRFVRKGNYVHSGIESLRSYDAEHASELLKTLKALLDYDCQTKEVIKKLHIHPIHLAIVYNGFRK